MLFKVVHRCFDELFYQRAAANTATITSHPDRQVCASDGTTPGDPSPRVGVKVLFVLPWPARHVHGWDRFVCLATHGAFAFAIASVAQRTLLAAVRVDLLIGVHVLVVLAIFRQRIQLLQGRYFGA